MNSSYPPGPTVLGAVFSELPVSAVGRTRKRVLEVQPRRPTLYAVAMGQSMLRKQRRA